MQHTDDFAGNDIRHTLGEAWRIARDRRWWFIFPFCVCATGAFVASHWLPRRFTSKSILERRNDPVLQALIGAAWNQAFEAQRASLQFDLKGSHALVEAADRTVTAKSWPRDGGGLTNEGLRRRADLVVRANQGVDVRVVESNPHRDVIEIHMTDSDPDVAAQMVVALREQYIERSRAKMMKLLVESRDYFQREFNRACELVRSGERRIAALEKEHPGVAPDYVALVSAEVSGLVYERTDLERRIAELKISETATLRQLGQAATRPADGSPIMRDNPKWRELAGEIARVQQLIADERVLRGKTDEHPSVVGLRQKLADLREEHARTPTEIPVSEDDLAGTVVTGTMDRISLENALTTTREQQRLAETRLDAVGRRLADIERQKVGGAEHRQEYAALREQLEKDREDLNTWTKQLEPLERMLAAQANDRGVRFISVQEPPMTARPTSPDARVMVLACLVIGAAGGALAVLLAELIDRSYRTAVQVTRSLGLAVIESIDEILTAPMRRKRMVRDYCILPLCGAGMLLVVSASGVAAYLSVQSPLMYEQLKHAPLQTLKAWLTGGAPPSVVEGVVPEDLSEAPDYPLLEIPLSANTDPDEAGMGD